MAWLWWAPLGAATLHIIEEFFVPGGFPEWDRRYRPAFRGSITPKLHIFINGLLLLVCVQVGFLGGSSETERLGAAAWLTLVALLFSNAIFHIVGTIRTRTRSPGVVTGIALYMPLTVVGYRYFLVHGTASWGTAAIAAALGSSYHLWAARMHRARARRNA